MEAAANNDRTYNPSAEAYWVGRLRESPMSGSYGKGLETGRARTQTPRQSLTRQLFFLVLKELNEATFSEHAREDYLYWQKTDKKIILRPTNSIRRY